MPRKITHPFQLELLQRQKDKARIERERKIRQRIFTLAERSNKERKQRIANISLVIARRRLAAQQLESSDDSELDSDSNLDVETYNENSFPNLKENSSKPFDFREIILGLIIGIFTGLCFGLVFSNQYTYLSTLLK
jgi:hypothetical protein